MSTAKSIQHDLFNELVQVAAVAVKIIELMTGIPREQVFHFVSAERDRRAGV